MTRRLIVAPFALLALVAGSATAFGASPRTITVSGTGTVTSVPNQAAFTFGVATNGKSAQQALSANASRMNRVISALKALGIRSANLQTAEISLNPNTNSNGTVIVGYSASNSVTATTDNVAKAGPIVDAAVGAGANLVSGPSLTPSDQALLNHKALQAAVLDARTGAEAIAAAAGVKLGALESVSEVSNSTPPVVPGGFEARAAGAATPVEAGTVQTEEDITATFAIS
jgi:uncharacterized protein